MNVLPRHYKPSEAEKKAGKYQGDPSIVFDTFVAVSRQDPLFIGWPDAELSADDRATLAKLLGNLTSFGRAEGWVHADLFDGILEWNCVSTDSDPNPVPVFCPNPDTVFGSEHYPIHAPNKLAQGKINPAEFLFNCPRWHLCLDPETIHEKKWPTVPGARWVNYTRPHESVRVPVKSRKDTRPKPTVARFLLDGPVLPLVTDTVRVAEAFRAAAMHRFERWCRKQSTGVESYRRTNRPDRFSSPVLSGKDAAGQYLRGHDHAYYLPTAEGDDRRRLTHVSVYARDGFDAGETAALTGLRSWRAGDLELRSQLVGLGRPSDFRAALFGGPAGAACVWESATPFIGPTHIGRSSRERYLRKALRRECRRAAIQRSADSSITDIEAFTDARRPSVDGPRSFEFFRGRARIGDDGYDRPFGMFRVTFSAPVEGPLSLGYASHYGLGLFLPLPEGPESGR
jgi:CRISPR-associated protein Csb2